MDKATLFISHSSKDALVATAFSDFMTHIGIPSSQITCSSAFGTHILTGTPLYSMLHQALSRDNVFFLMLLSDNYYSSAVCLNEMGAAWIKDLESLFFILPGFSFEKVKGVVKEKEPVGISLAHINRMTSERLYDFKQDIERKFGIAIESRLWEREREIFYQRVRQYSDEICPPVYMDEAESLCIGEFEHDGCNIVKKESDRVIADINFSLTKSDLCSIVFPTCIHDWTQFAESKKCLCFSVASSSVTPVNAEIELALARRKRAPIVITNRRNDYCIPLKEFSRNSSDFTSVQEICFLFSRSSITDGKDAIEINIYNISLD